jgi:hypothetical protein
VFGPVITGSSSTVASSEVPRFVFPFFTLQFSSRIYHTYVFSFLIFKLAGPLVVSLFSVFVASCWASAAAALWSRLHPLVLFAGFTLIVFMSDLPLFHSLFLNTSVDINLICLTTCNWAQAACPRVHLLFRSRPHPPPLLACCSGPRVPLRCSIH